MRVRIPSGLPIPLSSNGRTSDSDSANGGSNPSRGSSLLLLRLAGRAPDFDSGRVGSNPTGASRF